MSSDLDLTALTPLVDTLLSTSDSGLCDRVLLETLRVISGARAVALWRELDAETQAWHSVLEAGPASMLPSEAITRAVLAGAIDGELGSQQLVWGPVRALSPVAVALAGPLTGDLVLAEALFLLFAHIDPLAQEPGGSLPAPLPNQEGLAWRQEPSPLAPEIRRKKHDLRSILCSLTATHDLLANFASELDPPEFELTHAVLERDIKRVARLLATTAGGDRESLLPASDATVRDVVVLERVRCLRAGISLHSLIEETGTLPGLDEIDLRRLLENTLTNAIEAIQEASPSDGQGGEIALEWRREADHVLFAVEDSGAGWPQGIRSDQLFSEGFTCGKPEGTGIGLGVVSSLAKRVGGSCQATRGTLRGARLEVRFPLSGPRN